MTSKSNAMSLSHWNDANQMVKDTEAISRVFGPLRRNHLLDRSVDQFDAFADYLEQHLNLDTVAAVYTSPAAYRSVFSSFVHRARVDAKMKRRATATAHAVAA